MNNIKNLRIKAGLTQMQLADSLNVEQATVSFWESGKVDPRTDKLPELAKILNCSIDELLGNKV